MNCMDDVKYFNDKLYCALGIPRNLVDNRKTPCPFPDKLGIYILRENVNNCAVSITRKHIRWNGFRFIVDNFYDRKGNIKYSTYTIHHDGLNISEYIWDHIENGVDEFKTNKIDSKYLPKKDPSVLFDPYYLGGRKGNLW